MRAVKAKALRKQAKQMVEVQETSYIRGVKYANGEGYFVDTTQQVDFKCARGAYKVLKTQSKD